MEDFHLKAELWFHIATETSEIRNDFLEIVNGIYFFAYTHEVLFETSVTTCLRFKSTYLIEVFLEWHHEIIYIFSDEDF
jgi:hypothetical protein